MLYAIYNYIHIYINKTSLQCEYNLSKDELTMKTIHASLENDSHITCNQAMTSIPRHSVSLPFMSSTHSLNVPVRRRPSSSTSQFVVPLCTSPDKSARTVCQSLLAMFKTCYVTPFIISASLHASTDTLLQYSRLLADYNRVLQIVV